MKTNMLWSPLLALFCVGRCSAEVFLQRLIIISRAHQAADQDLFLSFPLCLSPYQKPLWVLPYMGEQGLTGACMGVFLCVCVHACVCACVCVCVWVCCMCIYIVIVCKVIFLWSTTIFKVPFVEMYINMVFVVSCLYSAMSLTLVREQCFIRFIIITIYTHICWGENKDYNNYSEQDQNQKRQNSPPTTKQNRKEREKDKNRVKN